jgi:regulator of protease activity HflC (stomatin/prohibitin superfamily)
MVAVIVVAVLVLVALFVASRSIRVIPQARAGVLERLGRYSRTLEPGLNIVVPFVERVRPLIDLREQVVNFKPQPVITQDNVVVAIETVLYFTINDPRAATYEIASPLQAIEQLTVTTLRNVIGGITLEESLTSRENVNTQLRGVLDEATGKWGIRINRVEIKSVDPPPDIKAAMEKQMRAERDRRAAILTAEGTKQAAILTAEGEKQSAVLKAEGARSAAILRAEGEAKAIATVFAAIHAGDVDQKLLSYQYLQMLPQLAAGEANKVFVIPSEFTQAFAGIGDAQADRQVTLLENPALEGYTEAHTTPLPPELVEVARETAETLGSAQMLTLRAGQIVDPREGDADTLAMLRFNEHVRNDERVVATLLSVRGGVTVIRRTA